MKSRSIHIAASCIILAFVVYVLSLGRELLLPLAMSLVFWYIIIRIIHFYQHLPKVSWRMPNSLALILAIITTGIVLYAFFLMLSHSIVSISHDAPLYQQKLQGFITWLDQHIGYGVNLNETLKNINLPSLFSRLALILSTIVTNFFLIVIYLIFLLLEYGSFDLKLRAMCKTQDQFHKVKHLVNRIDADISSYLKIKTTINAMAGILTYILLLSFGIRHAEFWGILVFLLHYIPFLGPIAAVLLILLAISIQIVHIVPFIGFAIILTAIQVLVGNVLEPKWMGSKLNLSPLAILLALAFWGALWGIIGMFLCVPFMVILVIILGKFPSTRSIAIMLSSSGDVDLER